MSVTGSTAHVAESGVPLPVPIISNAHFPEDPSNRLRSANNFENSPMLPKDRAIRYFQSEPNAPLVRAEIERHTDYSGVDAEDEFEPASADDTLDSVDASNFQNAHLAARIVAEQTQKRLARQRQQRVQSQHSHQHAAGIHRKPPRAVVAARSVTFSPRPKHSELGQQIKKLANASLAARQSLAKGAAPLSDSSRHSTNQRKQNSGSQSTKKKIASIAGPAFHERQRRQELARRRAQARKSGAESERNLARQRASKRSERMAEAHIVQLDRQSREQRLREQLKQERRTARKQRVGSREYHFRGCDAPFAGMCDVVVWCCPRSRDSCAAGA